MNARLLPYALILPVTLFLGVFFLYPFVLVAKQAFTQGAGFTLATPWEDTHDKPGVQHFDTVYVRGLDVRGGEIVDSARLSSSRASTRPCNRRRTRSAAPSVQLRVRSMASIPNSCANRSRTPSPPSRGPCRVRRSNRC